MTVKHIVLGLVFFQLLNSFQFTSKLWGHEDSPSNCPYETVEIGKGGRPILLAVEWNGRTYQFLLDTGAGKTTFDTSLENELGPPVGGSVLRSPAGLQTIELYKCPDVQVGSFSLDVVQTVASIDLAPIRYATGLEIYGVLGADFLIGKVFEINFDTGTLNFYAAPPPEMPNSDDITTLPISIIDGIPQIPIELPNATRTWIVADTGANRTSLSVDIFDGLVDSQKVSSISSHRTASVAGVRTSRSGTVSFLTLGTQRLEHIVVDGDGLSLLGIEQLSRFQARFDLINNRLSLRKGSGFSKPSANATSGMSIVQASGVKIVVQVKDFGAAFQAGVKPGDKIQKVNNETATNLDMFELREVLTHDPGKSITLQIERDRQLIAVDLRLTPLDTTQ